MVGSEKRFFLARQYAPFKRSTPLRPMCWLIITDIEENDGEEKREPAPASLSLSKEVPDEPALNRTFASGACIDS
jgi:hypothetical protein